MSDHYVKVKVQLEEIQFPGEETEKDVEVVAGLELSVSSSSSSSSSAAATSVAQDGKSRNDSGRKPISKPRSKSRGKPLDPGRRSRSKSAKDGTQGVASVNLQEKMENTACTAERLQNPSSNEAALEIKGSGKVLQGKAEQSKGQHGKEDGSKVQRKKRSVTVDSSKAKTSLEALKTSIKQLKWKEFPAGRRLPCDIYWHGVSFHDNENIFSGQVNKFPGMMEMVRKINLSRAVRTMHELFPEEYNFYPRSWILPEEFQLFAAEVRMAKENDSSWKPTFIVKPDGGSQGDGIYLIKDPNDFRMLGSAHNKPAVIQEYIIKPLLIDKLKFDIRLYVLVKSLEPLEIYIAKEGLSRFCTEPYQEPSQKNLHHVFMHLTNYSLNVHSGNFIHSDSMNTGSKRTFSSILYRLSSKGIDIKKVWSDIISLVIKTVIALAPELKVYYQADIPTGKPGPTCFQILGFDILLMKNLKPVLLEVNANPSMRIEHEQEVAPGVFEYVPSAVDEEVKVGVIRDTLRLVDPAPRKATNNQLRLAGIASEMQEDISDAGSSDKSEQDSGVKENNLPSLCLKQVLPKYAKQFNYLRVIDRIAELFVRFLGVKGTMRLGPTGFRTFIRNCKLCNSNLSMASVDILYIDITRRWNGMGAEQRESGMCLQAFVEAFFYLAQRRFKSLPLHEQVTALADLCGAAKRRAALAACQPEGIHSVPTAPAPPHHFNCPAAASKSADYRFHRPVLPTIKGNCIENSAVN
ncbi:tubulin polyglutamylase TTLL11-like [Huso huso]|uniref:Tubulin polyglutamylase TTLL11-like n=1 Tax=Huso huso TaxID=61971 RepID=A0ABR0YE01_HUSHU